jgi:DNA mismatch repair ATPase MutS
LDIYALIENDHRTVEELFAKLEETEDARARERLFEQLKSELMRHKEVEERTFYAALSTLPEISDLIEEAMEEHVDAEELLLELDGLDAEDEEWTATLQELREEIEHHVTEEEGQIFAEAKNSRPRRNAWRSETATASQLPLSSWPDLSRPSTPSGKLAFRRVCCRRR